MRLIYDSPDLAALTLTRPAAEESEGPGALERRMLDYLDGLEQRNGTAFLELVAITLASQGPLQIPGRSGPGHRRRFGSIAGRRLGRGAGRPRWQ
jgi:hypothetical protein